MTFKELLERVLDGAPLDGAAMTQVMRALMSGELGDIRAAAFLAALRAKGETVEELVAAAGVMRELATRPPLSADFPRARLIDTCGTGGDGARTFNISTAAAVTAAAAGALVAKHGNRAVSGRCGSADVLERAGAPIDLPPERTVACLREVGIGFFFAPKFHGAMRRAAEVRRALGVRTIFNLLGPLTNPAGARRQLVGVFDAAWREPLARAARALGAEHAMVVHADDGLDEISIAAPTRVVECRGDEISEYTLAPEDFGLSRAAPAALRADDADAALVLFDEALAGRPGAPRDVVALNAGAALYVAGLDATLGEGVARAQETLASGQAQAKLEQWKRFGADA